jgi:ADP-ribose pyrophosphatase YjhB (NUDIX family)
VARGPVSLARVEDADDAEDLGPAPFARELVRWSETLAGIARTGLGFTQSLYERERYEEVLHVAADIKAAADEALEVRRETDHFIQEWMESIGEGVPGYVTPKVAIGAVVGNERGEILLVKRAESGVWLYPTGWADIGYSPAEVAVKEVAEETGIHCEPVRVLAVIDGMRLGFTRFGMYMVVFHCRALGGELTPHPLETADVGWFAADALPWPTAGVDWWGPLAFAAIKGEPVETVFDAPRQPVWRPESQ